jgi:LemA protein
MIMGKNKLLWIIVPLAVILIIAGSFFSWYIGARNTLITADENIEASWAEVENQLQRRSDLIPNIVATVKGFASHEKEVFSNIAEARSRLAGASTVSEKAAGNSQLQGALSRLLVIVENYPQLKSDKNFLKLQDELSGTENRLTVARKRYNDQVKTFNTKIRVFPGSIIAGSMGFEKREYFEVAESAKEVPKVEF